MGKNSKESRQGQAERGSLSCLSPQEETRATVMSKLALTLFYLLYNLKYIRKVFPQASGEDKYKSQDSFKIKKKKNLHNFFL